MKPIDEKRWSEGKVEFLQRWTDTLFSIRVDADVYAFTAGQFTKLGLKAGDSFIERPYSYVNAPHETPLEFYFVTLPEGPLTQRMITLRPGDPIWVMRKASGFLVLDEVPQARDLWLLSTGTAIGPFLSILKTEQPWQRFERVVLVHAVRFAHELSFQETIRDIAERHGGRFRYVPFVSREDTDFALQGRITAALEDRRLERHAGFEITPEHAQVMICGNPEMVKETSALLQERGMQRNRRRTPGHVTVENYW